MKIISRLPEHGKRRSISLRLLFLVVLCSSLFTLLASIYQLFFYYQDDVDSIHDNMAFLQNSYLMPISGSLYSLDYEQLDLLLQSAIQLQGLEYIEILEFRGGKELKRMVGNPNTSGDIVQKFPLVSSIPLSNESYSVGTLTVVASFDNVYRRTLKKALVVIATNAVKMFLASFCILMIFQSVITRHLVDLAKFTQELKLKKQYTPIALDRKTRSSYRTDEFDQVVGALNHMQERISLDIEKREEAEEQLKASLKEKEVLLRELYHRTKNTMQVIRSMLLLQAARMPDNAQVQKLVTDTEHRIMAMALVHQKLYQSQDLSRISIQEYIEELAHMIMQSSAVAPERIALVLDIENISLLLDTAIPCGLILNELLSNTLKYAFPDERHGEIAIRLSRIGSERIELVFSDNGAGVPAGFDFRGQDTLGLRAICTIAEHQMQGQIRFDGEHGVCCTIEFPDTLYTERV